MAVGITIVVIRFYLVGGSGSTETMFDKVSSTALTPYKR